MAGAVAPAAAPATVAGAGPPPLVELALRAAAGGDAWLAQRRSVERLPPDVANPLLARLLARTGAPFAAAPHRLERFARCATRVHVTGDQLAAPAQMVAWLASFE
jgi:hypothetical protein